MHELMLLCAPVMQADLRQLLVDTVVLGHTMMVLSPQLNIDAASRQRGGIQAFLYSGTKAAMPLLPCIWNYTTMRSPLQVWYLGAWILLLFTLDRPGMPASYHLTHEEIASLLGDWHDVTVMAKVRSSFPVSGLKGTTSSCSRCLSPHVDVAGC